MTLQIEFDRTKGGGAKAKLEAILLDTFEAPPDHAVIFKALSQAVETLDPMLRGVQVLRVKEGTDGDLEAL